MRSIDKGKKEMVYFSSSMMRSLHQNAYEWVDIQNPTEEDIRGIISQHSIHPDIAEKLLRSSEKPCALKADGVLYASLHIPVHRRGFRHTEQQLAIILSESVFITSHLEPLVILEEFEKRASRGTGGIQEAIAVLLEILIATSEREITRIGKSLFTIEEHMFSDHEQEMVREISKNIRKTLDFSRFFTLHRPICEHMLSYGNVKKTQSVFASGIQSAFETLAEQNAMNGTYLTELRETNNALLSTRQNEIMTFFTGVTFITAPLVVIGALLTFHSPWNPIVGQPYDFYIITGIIALLALLMLAYFKHKRWL